MKKLLIILGKIPLFVLRWANAVVMRLPLAYIILSLVFGVAYRFINNEILQHNDSTRILILGFTVILSALWGLVYTLLKPPLTKRIFRNKADKKKKAVLRIILAAVLSKGYFDYETVPFLKGLFLFWMIELVVNALIINFKSSTMYDIAVKVEEYKKKHGIKTSSGSKAKKPAQNSKGSGESWKVKMSDMFDCTLGLMLGKGYDVIRKPKKGDEYVFKFTLQNKEGEKQNFHNLVYGEKGVMIFEPCYTKGLTVLTGKDGFPVFKDAEGKLYSTARFRENFEKQEEFIKKLVGEKIPVHKFLFMIDDRTRINLKSPSPFRFMTIKGLPDDIYNVPCNTLLSSSEIDVLEKLLKNAVLDPATGKFLNKEDDDYEDDYDYEYDEDLKNSCICSNSYKCFWFFLFCC